MGTAATYCCKCHCTELTNGTKLEPVVTVHKAPALQLHDYVASCNSPPHTPEKTSSCENLELPRTVCAAATQCLSRNSAGSREAESFRSAAGDSVGGSSHNSAAHAAAAKHVATLLLAGIPRREDVDKYTGEVMAKGNIHVSGVAVDSQNLSQLEAFYDIADRGEDSGLIDCCEGGFYESVLSNAAEAVTHKAAASTQEVCRKGVSEVAPEVTPEVVTPQGTPKHAASTHRSASQHLWRRDDSALAVERLPVVFESPGDINAVGTVGKISVRQFFDLVQRQGSKESIPEPACIWTEAPAQEDNAVVATAYCKSLYSRLAKPTESTPL